MLQGGRAFRPDSAAIVSKGIIFIKNDDYFQKVRYYFR